MKNKLWIIITLFLLMCPAIFASVPYDITIGNVQYAPLHPVIQKNGTLYLSDSDFKSITLCEITKNDKITVLTLGRNTISFTPNERIVKVNDKSTILQYFPIYEKNILYIPLSLLNILDYQYTFDSESQKLVLPYQAPRSLNSDSTHSHTLLDTNLKLIDRASNFKDFEASFADILNDSNTANHYVAFIDNQFKESLFKHLETKLSDSPYATLEVIFREFDTNSIPHTISTVKRLPLKAKIIEDKLVLDIDGKTINSNCMFTSYIAGSKVTSMDFDKSIDMTIMHMLYQYYRNTYDFKDDKYFTPFLTAQMDTADFITYPVYALQSPNDSTHIPYTIKVYRTHMKNKISYVIDVMK